MAKKTKKVKNEEVKTDEAKESNLGNSEASESGTPNTTETDHSLTDGNGDGTLTKSEVQEIEPIAYAVKLRSIHPQAGYGRAGFRFTKSEETVINVTDIEPDKVILLAEDPWLELVPICEE
ncbi:hypothetical protein BKK51_05905 [Rodentibacter trehalosifermentans]|uniref:Mu-like prophage FluMu N-terminal domain-containing protein n=1 Tax=Rodentibacter trehalosifermentans TaxID=1908263 RepID=A0A1V3ITP2_9PAST|nr:hypothetical protein [Rodentibacter trehalosifermentans]OOF45617.1 hypothetical protein BKK51_05905 [Rodentibacter trehalosifermentans]